MTDYLLVDDASQVPQALEALAGETSIALDTEFMRERTYSPRLCLLQFAAGPRAVIVDPVAIEDLNAFFAALAAPGREKVLHAARQDIEALLPATGTPLAPLFDTQVAAGLLGFPSQVGYGDLVERVLGVALPKAHARTDWARRPLSAEQLVYAAEDVHYLPPLRAELAARLDGLGRSTWASADSAALSDPALYRVDPALAWQRLKGLERATPAERAVARALAQWREERALRRDLPRGWVLSDEALRELARQRPATTEALAAIASVPPGLAARAGRELVELIGRARPGAEDQGVQYEERLTPEQTAAVKRLQERLQSVARELGVVPEVLATRRDLTAMVRGRRDGPALSGWRRDVIGGPLLDAL